MRVAIFGTVGAGKTTLIDTLKKMLPENYEIFWEPISQNPYFEDSYSPDIELARAATYKNEIYMLSARYMQFKESMKFNNVIYDRGIMDTLVFAHCNYDMGKIDRKDWEIYEEYFEVCVMPSIIAQNNKNGYDLVVYLQVTPETSIERITQRAIDRELNVDKAFWVLLTEKYEYWYNKLKNKMPFLVVNGNVHSPEIYAKQIYDKIIK